MNLSFLTHPSFCSYADHLYSDEERGSASKKRPSEYILTHGKPNPSAPASYESNQNRFRIYFESPPELDRVPKAARRNPNKRWRRESSSVAPSRMGEGRAETATVDGGLESARVDEGLEEAVHEEIQAEAAQDGAQAEAVQGEIQAEAVEETGQAEAVEERGQAEAILEQAPAEVDQEDAQAKAVHEHAQETATHKADQAVDGSAIAAETTEEAEDTANIELLAQTVEGEALSPTNPTDAPLSTEKSDPIDHPTGMKEPTIASQAVPEPTDDELSAPPAFQSQIAATNGLEEESTEVPELTEVPGDISMITDASAVAEAISELVDAEPTELVVPVANGSVVGDLSATKSQDVTSVSDDTKGDNPVEDGQDSAETGGAAVKEDHASDEHAGAEASAAEVEAALARSAENAASAYKSRGRRRSSVSTVDSQDEESTFTPGVPSTNRLSILYEDSSRRLCFDAAAVEKVRIFREEGKIEVVLDVTREKREASTAENAEEGNSDDHASSSLPKGVLVSALSIFLFGAYM